MSTETMTDAERILGSITDWNQYVQDQGAMYRANLSGANLRGANLYGATIGARVLTGRYSWIGEAASCPVLLLATECGHVLRAGCVTCTLDEAVGEALRERGDDLTRIEAEAVVAHGRALLAAWASDETNRTEGEA